MKPESINLSEWVKFGVGAYGDSFYHITDPDIMLKLYHENENPKFAEREYISSKMAYEMEIPCPDTYRFVTDGQRVGIILERLHNKTSFASKFAEEAS